MMHLSDNREETDGQRRAPPPERHLVAVSQTCYVKFYLQGHFVGQGGVTQQLVGLFQRSIFSGDPVDRQEAVSHLQQATPTTQVTMVTPHHCHV